jgi:hypothetical protein
MALATLVESHILLYSMRKGGEKGKLIFLLDTPTNPGQTNPGHDKPWAGQTLDTTNPGQNRTGGMHTWQCKLRFCVHNFADFR